MKGSRLREIRLSKGLQAKFVAERAGFTTSHFAKIEAKDDITVDEFERIMRAMDLKPGDVLENSLGDLSHLMDVVALLRAFPRDSGPALKTIVEGAYGLLK